MRAFQALVIFVLVTSAPLLEAVPPPPPQVRADCTEPSYASDQLVCADAELLELDRLLGSLIERGGPVVSDAGDDEDWFRRSRRCAFDTAHRECLMAAYCLRLAVLAPPEEEGPETLCAPEEDYLPASKFSRAGFARADVNLEPLLGREIRVQGFVDHLNIYGDEAAKAILGEWWAGAGPDEQTWRFGLKADESDPAGHAIYVEAPNDLLRNDLLSLFAADARAGRPTQVYLRGRLFTFDAPLNVAGRTGLRLEVASTRDLHPAFEAP